MHILIYLNIFQPIRLSSSLLSIMLLSNNVELIAKQKNFFSDFFLFFFFYSLENIMFPHESQFPTTQFSKMAIKISQLLVSGKIRIE